MDRKLRLNQFHQRKSYAKGIENRQKSAATKKYQKAHVKKTGFEPEELRDQRKREVMLRIRCKQWKT